MVPVSVQKAVAVTTVSAMLTVAFSDVVHGKTVEVTPPVPLTTGTTVVSAPAASVMVIPGHQSAISHEFYQAPANPQALRLNGLTFPSG